MRHPFVVAATLALLLFVVSVRAGKAQGTPQARAASVTVQVDATHPWVDAGVNVKKGERLLFATNGTIQWGADPGQVAGPEGHGAKPGKLGVGGRLFLGINDFVFGDNVGAFTVVISHPAAP